MTLDAYCHIQASDLRKAVEALDYAERRECQRDIYATHLY